MIYSCLLETCLYYEEIRKKGTECPESVDVNKLRGKYKFAKQEASVACEIFVFKEPNLKGPDWEPRVCLNGYINTKQAKVLSQFWNICQKSLKLLKLMRRELIRRQYRLSRIGKAHLNDKENDNVTNILALRFVLIERLMMLIKIVNMVYRDGISSSKLKSDNICELECFLPFIQYELEKAKGELAEEFDSKDEIDRAKGQGNFALLLGIVSNKFRDQHSVWSYERLNYAVIDCLGVYLEDCLKDNKETVKYSDLTEMNETSLSFKKKKLEDKGFSAKIFYEGRKQASIMSYNQNTSLLQLVKVVIYSFTFKGNNYNNAQLIPVWNELISQGYSDEKISSHIKGLLVILFSNINIITQN